MRAVIIYSVVEHRFNFEIQFCALLFTRFGSIWVLLNFTLGTKINNDHSPSVCSMDMSPVLPTLFLYMNGGGQCDLSLYCPVDISSALPSNYQENQHIHQKSLSLFSNPEISLVYYCRRHRWSSYCFHSALSFHKSREFLLVFEWNTIKSLIAYSLYPLKKLF